MQTFDAPLSGQREHTPIRVLSVMHYPGFGGPTNRNVRVKKTLDAHGVDTTLVLPDEPGNAVQGCLDHGVEPVVIPLRRLRATTNPREHVALARGLRRNVAELRSLIRSRDIDVVLVNGTANPHAAIAARAEGKPVVWQILDTFPPLPFLALAMPYIRRVSTVLMTTGYTTAAAHPGALEFPGPLISFGPCIPTEQFTRTEETRREMRSYLGYSEDDVVVGNVANFNQMKGHATFLRAARRLKDRMPSAKFLFIGGMSSPDYYARTMQLAEELGFTLGEDLRAVDGGTRVSELAQVMDLFWMTSEPRSEGIPTSLAEALCLGIPSIATRVGGVHECIQEGRNGFIVPPWDDEAVADRSYDLLSDRQAYLEFSASAAAHIRSEFSVEATAARHLEAYRVALARGPRKSQVA